MGDTWYYAWDKRIFLYTLYMPNPTKKKKVYIWSKACLQSLQTRNTWLISPMLDYLETFLFMLNPHATFSPCCAFPGVWHRTSAFFRDLSGSQPSISITSVWWLQCDTIHYNFRFLSSSPLTALQRTAASAGNDGSPASAIFRSSIALGACTVATVRHGCWPVRPAGRQRSVIAARTTQVE